MRIGLFGGSFDPPHLGHVMGAAYALSMGQLDALWVLPTYKHAYAKEMAEFEVRMKMCQQAFGILRQVMVLRFELNNLSGHTVELVGILKAGRPDDTFVLIVGSDCVQDCENWHRWLDLEKMVEVLEVPRGGYSSSSPLPEISSTQVRELVASGDEAAMRKLVPHEVVKTLQERNLYRASKKS